MTPENTNGQNAPKDFFMYLLSITSLYVFIISLISLLFNYVNYVYPDTAFTYLTSFNLQSIRWNITILSIAFPVFLYTTLAIRKDYLQYPNKLKLKVRKWLFYLTLFITAIIILSDLGTLLYYFLGGEITTRFLLKIVILFVVASSVFSFYLRELHQSWKGRQLNVWLWIAVSTVILILLYGFYLAGTPGSARKAAFDTRRIRDLNIIQTKIITYWKKTKHLPNSLNALTDTISGFKAPSDPETKISYEYKILSNNAFQLCSNFNLPSSNTEVSQSVFPLDDNWNWQHPAGHYCFVRTIDQQLYGRK